MKKAQTLEEVRNTTTMKIVSKELIKWLEGKENAIYWCVDYWARTIKEKLDDNTLEVAGVEIHQCNLPDEQDTLLGTTIIEGVGVFGIVFKPDGENEEQYKFIIGPMEPYTGSSKEG